MLVVFDAVLQYVAVCPVRRLAARLLRAEAGTVHVEQGVPRYYGRRVVKASGCVIQPPRLPCSLASAV